MSKIRELTKAKAITPPLWMKDNIMFEAMSGSVAYGVSKDSSDKDYIAWCIPPREDVFYANELPNFGKPKDRFQQYQQHGIIYNDNNYDVTCYSISKYFHLCMECNPNMVESLFYPIDVITHSTNLSNLVRDNRKMFLHKGAMQKLKGYAFSQLSKALAVSKDKDIIEIRKFETDNNIDHTTTFKQVQAECFNRSINQVIHFSQLPDLELDRYHDMFNAGLSKSKRFESQKIHNADTKFMYHLARLTNYAKQILDTGDLDVRQDREYWKAIRRGDVDIKLLQEKFEDDERYLQRLYETSSLQKYPDESAIKTLLLQCLESHYGSIPVVIEDAYKQCLLKISDIIQGIKW